MGCRKGPRRSSHRGAARSLPRWPDSIVRKRSKVWEICLGVPSNACPCPTGSAQSETDGNCRGPGVFSLAPQCRTGSPRWADAECIRIVLVASGRLGAFSAPKTEATPSTPRPRRPRVEGRGEALTWRIVFNVGRPGPSCVPLRLAPLILVGAVLALVLGLPRALAQTNSWTFCVMRVSGARSRVRRRSGMEWTRAGARRVRSLAGLTAQTPSSVIQRWNGQALRTSRLATPPPTRRSLG